MPQLLAAQGLIRFPTAAHDSIVNTGSNVTFQYADGDGNDFIDGFDETSTLKVMSGSVAKLTSDGTDLVINFSDNSAVTLTDAATLGSSFNLVNASGNAIDFGTVEVTGTDDADTIDNYFDNAIIDAGDGNDTIYNGDSEVTINAGAGDDTISLSSYVSNNLIQYSAGDGNDIIYGLNSTSSLQVLSGTVTKVSRNYGSQDLILTIGEGTVSLKGAYSLDSLNIVDSSGAAISLPAMEINGSEDYNYYTNNDSNVMINASDSDDTIDNRGSNVTINALGGYDSIVNGSSYTKGGFITTP